MSDSLFDARNFLVVGNFKQAMVDASTARCNSKKKEEMDDFQVEKALLMAQAHLGLQQESAVQSLPTLEAPASLSSNPALQAVQWWGEFLFSGKSSAQGFSTSDPNVSAALERLVSSATEVDFNHTYTAIFAVSALITVKDYTAALTLANQWTCQLTDITDAKVRRQRTELHYLNVEALLRINRPDQAKIEVTAMEQVDDESVFTILAQGMLALYMGQSTASSEAYERAKSIFSGATVRYGQTPMLLNLIAIANMGLLALEDSERALEDAAEIASSPAYDTMTAVNRAAVQAHGGRVEDNDTLMQLMESPQEGGSVGWRGSYAEANQRILEAVAKFSQA